MFNRPIKHWCPTCKDYTWQIKSKAIIGWKSLTIVLPNKKEFNEPQLGTVYCCGYCYSYYPYHKGENEWS